MIQQQYPHNYNPIQPPQPQVQPQNNSTQKQKPTFYEIISEIKLEFTGTTTYRKMLEDKSSYKQDEIENDVEFMKRLNEVGFNKLDDTIFQYHVDMQPENVQWNSWKHPSQMNKFIDELDHQIAMMQKYVRRIPPTGNQIIALHQKLKSVSDATWEKASLRGPEIADLQKFLNLFLNHPFLRKSVPGLTFVEHCLPLEFWHLKCIQQVAIYKDKNVIAKMFNKQKQIKQYITITSDGVLISTKNLLETKIDRMIPFTSYFEYSTQVQSNKYIRVNLSSSLHSNHVVNFMDDYIAGVNFHLGVKQALKESRPSLEQGDVPKELVTGILGTANQTHKNHGENRFHSFSTTRKNCATKLYNDGKWYFSDLCDELRKARNQVLITDWWMTPYFLLKRPNKNNQTHPDRLDTVLKECGDRGVKVFIILFRQPLDLLCNDSYDCQLHLENMSRNIRVRRHPIVPQAWSHHEKCVVIDQKVAFMGGLDICYGRWDNHEHHLIEPDPKNPLWDGGDYTNERLRGFGAGTTKKWWESPIDREKQTRMPWHDIALQLRGDSVIDLAKHFIQYWYFVDAEKVKDPYNHLRNLQKRFDRASSYEEPDWDRNELDEDGERAYTFGQQFSLCGKRTKLFFTGTEKRLPQLLIKARTGQQVGNQQLQMCRSASPWSIGARVKEDSIHQAYQSLIKESKSHIYIQNQFFMGVKNEIVNCLAQRIERAHKGGQNFKVIVVMPLLPGFDGQIDAKTSGPLRIQVHNQFQSINRGENSLHQKLKHLKNFDINNYIFFFGLRAHAKMSHGPETQIIYVHSKLMIVDDRRCIIGSANINDRSLMGDRDSELAIVIEENNGEIWSYDPKKGTQNFKGIPNGAAQGEIDNSKGIFGLRTRIYNEHFGITEEETANINNPQIWSKIIGNAKKNVILYRKVFGCYPDDTITVSDQLQERKDQANLNLYDQLMPQVVGHAVEFPLLFMQDEDLEFQPGDKENLAGPEMFL